MLFHFDHKLSSCVNSHFRYRNAVDEELNKAKLIRGIFQVSDCDLITTFLQHPEYI